MIHTLFVDRSFGVPRGTDFLFRGKKKKKKLKRKIPILDWSLLDNPS